MGWMGGVEGLKEREYDPVLLYYNFKIINFIYIYTLYIYVYTHTYIQRISYLHVF